ncbi:ribonuclease P protein component [Sporolactobacillus spathodeae]|uniref:Ribonuclease P protein component n=1 Tax=Sporolactobacillus spathodeae TaxID=1465502 RepID=A0ABS2Q4U7_9BACL|nr:ribonuclease P protein component [Sporolactobacillus spathodeae]MBM7656785.1 ribonuclease P protein component [Sporolactobacillus spathodeae]
MKKIRRLKKNKDFQVVFKDGRSMANRQFVVYVLAQPGQTYARLGLSVSKKMGNAVMRNHIKRLIKESFREFAEKLETGNDYIIISRRPVRTMSYHEVQGSLKHVLKKAGVMTD